ncbi:hypothetical protein A2574_01130 [Candidatus Shapirobacteria bacterium RIFOXYD1_FULL_38_32]|uniref:PD-(D/E)XK endonuclease-like domain-containing protein n=1 Tax=Candidatus Shapirobacteria bacterium GW2011_GWE2_38_30 TaxID=1618490 RepID=A0A0G0JV20_9BACT|nr:MAG: hypothetical protein US90_C0006G0045 [Candidatus Shapirobacteria bacterium GW2011_GWE2_38_30]OGL55011.1 MAG: hypothetical protein A2195_01735 [Candidatus Shapirobacteria bacterium RIFOXYA1_FULL_39_17]OGL57506.1 MAG: hypothetical protein A2574_01130 [Candidatus Shapirobacteria bacterium RIFOXYD1_FULL_38_32]HAP37595.1 hypothetical protein [Candidatus Shapirobacteria bacterium]HCU55026.1 hypothetical protein [Candidatus Shapirobacteria bacterium]
MPKDKYTAVWVSHSSISTFLKCPRAYYLQNVYKDPATGHKIKIISPPLALGQAVHEVLESLSVLPTVSRFKQPLLEKFEKSWKKVSGKNGGFLDSQNETIYKNRGIEMIQRVIKNPGPLKNLSVKMSQDLPYYWLSEDDNIILCGKVDWLEYLSDTDSVHIIDFKTSKYDESVESLQLPIYHLLVHNCQKRKVSKASYWYLDRSDDLQSKELPDLENSHQQVLKVAKQIKLARSLERFKCPQDGCRDCLPFERILHGEGEFVGLDDFKADTYILPKKDTDQIPDSTIL